MGEPADKSATYEDLFELPPNVVGEIINGELITHPRPGPKHANASSALAALLRTKFGSGPTRTQEDWWILFEPECHLGKDIVVPDIAGWRKTTMPELPDTAWFNVRPDWVCEVVSPSTAKYDRGIKREIYAGAEVPHYWLVDPIARIIEVFVLRSRNWIQTDLASDEQVVNLEPFEILPFDLTLLWA